MDEERRDAENETAVEAAAEAGEEEALDPQAPQEDAPAPPPPVPMVIINPARVFTYAGLLSAFVMLFGAGMFFAGWGVHSLVHNDNQSTQAVQLATPTQAAVAPAAQPTPPAVVDISAGHNPAWGPEDAKVTVIEFSDFQCPYCQRFATQTLPQLRQAYGDKIRFVYRDFPLSAIHQYAMGAAEAAECANEQGKFWEYSDQLWANQAALQVTDLKSYAGKIGLDQAQFDACLDGHKYVADVQANVADGNKVQVQGTPTFFVNGRRLIGALPFAQFQQAIDAALNGTQ